LARQTFTVTEVESEGGMKNKVGSVEGEHDDKKDKLGSKLGDAVE